MSRFIKHPVPQGVGPYYEIEDTCYTQPEDRFIGQFTLRQVELILPALNAYYPQQKELELKAA